ncbi:hypothetical protein GEMRC1_001785 [Eukaryota sp. GEM-RC1]
MFEGNFWTDAHLIGFVKPGQGIKSDGIRPIAFGQSISRFFASIVFNRVVDTSGRFLSPFQSGIKISSLLFNSHDDNLTSIVHSTMHLIPLVVSTFLL